MWTKSEPRQAEPQENWPSVVVAINSIEYYANWLFVYRKMGRSCCHLSSSLSLSLPLIGKLVRCGCYQRMSVGISTVLAKLSRFHWTRR